MSEVKMEHYMAEQCCTNYKTVSHRQLTATDMVRWTVLVSPIVAFGYYQCQYGISVCSLHSVSKCTESVGCELAGSSASMMMSRACVHTLCRRRRHAERTSAVPRWDKGTSVGKSILQHQSSNKIAQGSQTTAHLQQLVHTTEILM